MPFTLPTFNLNVQVWHYATWFGNFPTVIPAADFTVVGNLALARRVAGNFGETMWLLVPAFTDLRDAKHANPTTAQGDIVEVPSGSGRFYYVLHVDDAAKGFANEHRFANITPDVTAYPVLPNWPVPYP